MKCITAGVVAALALAFGAACQERPLEPDRRGYGGIQQGAPTEPEPTGGAAQEGGADAEQQDQQAPPPR